MIDELIKLYSRDLDRLKDEMMAFRQEDNLWIVTKGVSNCAGNLCLHLVGNLKTYVGRNMGGFHYIRDREAEFNLKDVPRDKLIEQVTETRHIVLATLKKMDEKKLAAIHQEEVLGYEMTNRYFLIHLAAHLSYHLGQINYLRRILEND